MATKIFTGNAQPTKQTTKVTPANVAEGAEFYLEINGKRVSYLAVAGDGIADVVAGLLAAATVEDAPPEFAELTYTDEGSHLLVEGQPGIPYTLTAGTEDASDALQINVTTLKVAQSATNEKQLVTLAGTPTGGTFTLTYDGETTAAIDYNATAAAVQSALEALSNIGAGDVTVTDYSGGGWLIEFSGDLEGDNVSLLTGSGASLTGQTGYITHATTTEGSTVTNEVLTFTITYLQPTSTAYTALLVNGSLTDYTVPVASNISAAPSATAIRDLLQYEWRSGNISVTRTLTSTTATYTITWQGEYAGVNVSPQTLAFLSAYTEADSYWTLSQSTTTEGSTTASDEVQTVTINHSPTGGTFTLTYSGQTTGAIAYNASASTVETALEALSNITDVTVSKSGPVYTITFVDPGDQNVAQLTSTSSLTGSGVIVSVEQEAVAAVAWQSQVYLSGNPTGGTFSLAVSGTTAESDAIAYNATALAVENALNGMFKRSPTSLSSEALSGDVAWSDPSNAGSSDNVYATATMGIGETTEKLIGSDFDFAIPTAATITGIEVFIECKASVGNAAKIASGYIYKDASGGSPEATFVTDSAFFGTTDSTLSYGPSLFSSTWTPAEINNALFGISIDLVDGGGAGVTASIDHMAVKIHYTVGGVTFTQTMSVSGAPGGPWTVTGELGAATLSLTGSDNNLTGAGDQALNATTTIACTGPNFWNDADNWDTGAVPVNSDDVWLQHSSTSILYGLDQSAVTLTSLHIMASYTGSIGLPNHTGEYQEYRTKKLTIGATAFYVGEGEGPGSPFLRISNSNIQTALTVLQTGQSNDGNLPAFQWDGTNASNTLNLYRGSFGAAVYAGETATIATINQGYIDSPETDTFLTLGSGCTLTTITKNGGETHLRSGCTTLTVTAGDLTIHDTGSTIAITTLTQRGGTVSDRATGTITTGNISSGAIYDRRATIKARTFTNCSINAGCEFHDDNGTVVFTNPMQLVQCSLEDVVLNLGNNRTIQVA